jgi:hypothetical protein
MAFEVSMALVGTMAVIVIVIVMLQHRGWFK